MSKPQSLDIPLMELRPHHCREVTGIGADGLALYCGQPKSGRTSYCTEHRRINLTMVTNAPRPNERGANHSGIASEARLLTVFKSFAK